MTKKEWGLIKYFSPKEDWGDPDRMEFYLVYLLDRLRFIIGKPIIIHYGTQGKHSPNSWHYVGKAVDFHAKGISLFQLFLSATRFPFGGIGVYPFWDNPGLHVDTRPRPNGEPQARWGRINGEYIPLNEEFFRKYVLKND